LQQILKGNKSNHLQINKLKLMRSMKLFAVLTLMFFGFSVAAQDINQAIEVFNEGNQALQGGNLELALEKYEVANEMASKLGEEGLQIVAAAQKQIPTLYYQLGVQDYRDKNNEKAIAEFENAIKYGEQYNDAETVAKAKDIIPKIYNAMGNDFFKENDFEQALANFSKSAELDPNYSRAYWGQGLAYNKMGKNDEMDAAFKKARELATAEGDNALVDRINTTGKRFLQTEGASLLQAQKWNDALKSLNASNDYNAEDAETYYYIALAYNGLSKWEEAAKAAQTGIDLSADATADNKAKFYFELGNAYKGAGNIEKACGAYSNAKFGRFVDNANYEMTTVLKCN